MGLTKRRELTIEPATPSGSVGVDWHVIEHGTYEKGSVLEGLPKRTFVDAFLALETAIEVYPTAEVLDHSTKEEGNPLPEVAPDWFDPTICGERWDEDY